MEAGFGFCISELLYLHFQETRLNCIRIARKGESAVCLSALPRPRQEGLPIFSHLVSMLETSALKLDSGQPFLAFTLPIVTEGALIDRD